MQKQQNARQKNLSEMGNVIESFQRMYNMIPINDGIRKSKGVIKNVFRISFCSYHRFTAIDYLRFYHRGVKLSPFSCRNYFCPRKIAIVVVLEKWDSLRGYAS